MTWEDMKKTIKLIIILLGLVTSVIVSPVFAIDSEKVAVVPVDLRQRNSNYSVYSDTLYLVANDLINTLSNKYRINTLDLTYVEGMINSHRLHKEYYDFLRDYKNTYTINQLACSKLAQKLDVDKIILVTGDFDTENMVFKKDLYNRLEIIGVKPFRPTYKMNIVFTLVDTHTGSVIFEKPYSKYFPIEDFTSPITQYNNYSVSIGKMKKFSRSITQKVSSKVNSTMAVNYYNTVNSHIIKTNNPIEDKYNSSFTTKEGTSTKDGQSSYTSVEYKNEYSTKRKDNYKQWVKSNLP